MRVGLVGRTTGVHRQHAADLLIALAACPADLRRDPAGLLVLFLAMVFSGYRGEVASAGRLRHRAAGAIGGALGLARIDEIPTMMQRTSSGGSRQVLPT